MNSLHDLIKAVQNLFHTTVHAFLDGVAALSQSIQANLGDVGYAVIAAAVAAAEQAGGTGADKRDAALKAALVTLEAKGIPIVMAAINGAIEVAVAALKKV